MKEKVGTRIKSLREMKGFSQEEIADKLHISRSTYERIENGKSNSWASHIEQLSKLFEVNPEYFVQDDGKNILNSENQNGGVTLQNNGKIRTLNNLSEKLIEQYEARLKEKDEVIAMLKEKIAE